MHHRSPTYLAVVSGLVLAVLVPVLYYGVQVAAALWTPGYDPVRQAASELGHLDAPAHTLFNVGVLLLGAVTVLAGVALATAFRWTGRHPVLAYAAGGLVVLSGVQAAWAGWYPMPDPRHGGHPIFIAGMLALPLVLGAALWVGGSRAVRAYVVANALMLGVMVPVMTRALPFDLAAYTGLAQRCFTLAIFVPIGVAGAALLRRLTAPAGRPAAPARVDGA